jgi:Zn-finger nucleic acid-binding protein
MSARSCLRCAADLTPTEKGGVTRHVCGSCGGMWIDDDQLDRLLVRLGLSADEPLGPIEHHPSNLPCPVCTKPMEQESSYGTEPRVLIDVCADHGAWFDRDELGVIVYDLQEEHVARSPLDLDAGTSLGTALRALATTVRMAKVQPNRVRGRRDTLR